MLENKQNTISPRFIV